MQGSAMMYVTGPSLRDELVDELWGSFGQGRPDHDPVEPGCLRGAETGRVGVIREPQDGHVCVDLGHLVGIDAGDVDDHEVGRVDALRRRQPVTPAEEHVELSSKEQVDPNEQDRGHGGSVPSRIGSLKGLW
jgi:hypothetical protein